MGGAAAFRPPGSGNFVRRGGDRVDPAPCGGHLAGPAQEAVDHSLAADDPHRHAGLAEPSRIVESVVAQDVRFGDCDDGGCQPGELSRRKRRELRRFRCRPGAIDVPVPGHLCAGKVVSGRELAVRGARAGRVERRVEQQLQLGLRGARRAQPQRQCCGEVSARAVSGDREAFAVRPEARAADARPPPCGFEVVEGGRIDVFGRAAVPDRDEYCVQRSREYAAQPIVRVERAGHPAAAVRIEHERQRRCRLRPVDAHGYRSRRPGYLRILDAAERFRLAAEAPRRLLGRCAQRFDVGWRRTRRRGEYRVEQTPDIGIEHR
jgi:hypothetical protein